MDIRSLSNDIKRDITITGDSLYDLFGITFVYNPSIFLYEYLVTDEDEMRIDLVFKNMYNIDYDILANEDSIDIILFINNIDNPLNIKKGSTLQYPLYSDLEQFRYVAPTDNGSTSITQQLSVPNKTTRTDNSRQNFLENGYSLSPVILDTPIEPVRVINGKFSIGGL